MSSIIQATLIAMLITCEMFYGNSLHKEKEIIKVVEDKQMTFERLHKYTE